MIVPKTCYAKSGELSIAYQVVGEGPFDVVFVPGFNSNLDLGWEMPMATLYRRIASFARLIIFDKRGTGLSDRNCGIPSLENGSTMSARLWLQQVPRGLRLFGFSEGGAMALMFAATYPNRTRSLVRYGALCKCPGWVIPPPPDNLDEMVDKYWGTGASVARFAPSLSANPSFRELWARYERAGASPSAIKALVRINNELDVGPILGSVRHRACCCIGSIALATLRSVVASQSICRTQGTSSCQETITHRSGTPSVCTTSSRNS